jgi:hypothetical protein
MRGENSIRKDRRPGRRDGWKGPDTAAFGSIAEVAEKMLVMRYLVRSCSLETPMRSHE